MNKIVFLFLLVFSVFGYSGQQKVCIHSLSGGVQEAAASVNISSHQNLNDIHRAVASYSKQQVQVTSLFYSQQFSKDGFNFSPFPNATFFKDSANSQLKTNLSDRAKRDFRNIAGRGVKELVRAFVYNRLTRASTKGNLLDRTYAEEIYAYIMENFLTNVDFLKYPLSYLDQLVDSEGFLNSQNIEKGSYANNSRNQLVELASIEFLSIVFVKLNQKKQLNDFLTAIYVSDLLQIKYSLPESDIVYSWTWLVRILDYNFNFGGQFDYKQNYSIRRISKDLPFDQYRFIYAEDVYTQYQRFSTFFSFHVYPSKDFIDDPLTYLDSWSHNINWQNPQNRGLSHIIVELARAYSYLELVNKQVLDASITRPLKTYQKLEYYWSLSYPDWINPLFEVDVSEVHLLNNLAEVEEKLHSFLAGYFKDNVLIINDKKNTIAKPTDFGHFVYFALTSTILDPKYLENPSSYLELLKANNFNSTKLKSLETYSQILFYLLDSIQGNEEWEGFLRDISANIDHLKPDDKSGASDYRSKYWGIGFGFTNIIGNKYLKNILQDWDEYLLTSDLPISGVFAIEDEINIINEKFNYFNSHLVNFQSLENNDSLETTSLNVLVDLHNFFFDSIEIEEFKVIYNTPSKQRFLLYQMDKIIADEQKRKNKLLEIQVKLRELSDLHKIYLSENKNLVEKRLGEIITNYSFLLDSDSFLDNFRTNNVFFLDEDEVKEDQSGIILDSYIIDFLISQLNLIDVVFKEFLNNLPEDSSSETIETKYNEFNKKLNSSKGALSNVELLMLRLKFLVHISTE